MMRETLAAGSKRPAFYVTPGKGISFQYRDAAGGVSGTGVAVTGTTEARTHQPPRHDPDRLPAER
jgi:hypothetical protein